MFETDQPHTSPDYISRDQVENDNLTASRSYTAAQDQGSRERDALAAPDKNCNTLPNGDCIGKDCMHDARSPEGEALLRTHGFDVANSDHLPPVYASDTNDLPSDCERPAEPSAPERLRDLAAASSAEDATLLNCIADTIETNTHLVGNGLEAFADEPERPNDLVDERPSFWNRMSAEERKQWYSPDRSLVYRGIIALKYRRAKSPDPSQDFLDEMKPLEGTKDSNPKDAVGITKVPYSTISAPVLSELGLAMLEGALKYGRHNYRFAGVRASVYYDAVVARHLARWWEGEDIDPDTIVRDDATGEVIFEGISHLTKAMAGLSVIRDAMIQDKFIDDRPPHSPPGWQDKINEGVKAFNRKYPDPVAPYLHGFKRGSGRTEAPVAGRAP